MDLNLTRRWFDAGTSSDDLSLEGTVDRSPPQDESVFLAIQLGNLISHCTWEALEMWEKEAKKRPSAFSTMALSIIKNARMAATRVMQEESLPVPDLSTIHDRMRTLISIEENTPAFASAIDDFAEQLQPVLGNSIINYSLRAEISKPASSLYILSTTAYSGVSALAPKSLKTGIEGSQENQSLAREPLEKRDPRAIVFALMGEVANTIFIMTGEQEAYRSTNNFIGEQLHEYQKWPDRVRKSPLPITSQS